MVKKHIVTCIFLLLRRVHNDLETQIKQKQYSTIPITGPWRSLKLFTRSMELGLFILVKIKRLGIMINFYDPARQGVLEYICP